jgi:hypothetical protein
VVKIKIHKHSTYICAAFNLEVRTCIFLLIHATSILEVRIHTFHSDPPKTSFTPILGVNYLKRYSIIFIPSIFLLAYKAPNIYVATSFNLSVSKEAWVLFALLKKKGKEREEGKEKYLYPHLKNIYI